MHCHRCSGTDDRRLAGGVDDSPWQRGSNENTNGLLRDFYPKGTNFNDVTDDDLAETQRLLNIRPRETLKFRSPHAMLNQLINGVALAS